MNQAANRQGNSDGRLREFLRSHRQVASISMRRLLATPLASAVAVLVIAIALSLPTLLYLLNANLQAGMGEVSQTTRITLFLKIGLTEAEENDVSEHLHTISAIESIEFIGAEQALQEFSRSAGLGSVLGNLPENPLPASIIITPTPGALTGIEELVAQLEQLGGVDVAQLDREWLARLQALSNLLALLGRILLLLVLAGLVAIVGNTIKLAIESRRREIQVIKLIGGTSSYIARPFLYTGFYLGCAGGFLACLLLLVMGFSLGGAMATLSALYGGEWRLSGLNGGEYLALIMLGGGTGWMAAFFASYRNIATIEPS